MAKKNNEELTMRGRAHERVDKMMDKKDSMQESGREKMQRLNEKAMASKESVDHYIRENPEKSVLIAAGVGAVAGAVIATTVIKKWSATA